MPVQVVCSVGTCLCKLCAQLAVQVQEGLRLQPVVVAAIEGHGQFFVGLGAGAALVPLARRGAEHPYADDPAFHACKAHEEEACLVADPIRKRRATQQVGL